MFFSSLWVRRNDGNVFFRQVNLSHGFGWIYGYSVDSIKGIGKIQDRCKERLLLAWLNESNQMNFISGFAIKIPQQTRCNLASNVTKPFWATLHSK